GVGGLVEAEGLGLVLGYVRVDPSDTEVDVALDHPSADCVAFLVDGDRQAILESSLHDVTRHLTPPVWYRWPACCHGAAPPQLVASGLLLMSGPGRYLDWRLWLLALYQPQPVGLGNSLCSGTDTQLCQHRPHLVLHSPQAHVVALGYLGVLETLLQEGEDLALPGCEPCRMSSGSAARPARYAADAQRPQSLCYRSGSRPGAKPLEQLQGAE